MADPKTGSSRMMTTTTTARSGPGNSPLAAAVNRIGDRWSLLVIDALMDGPRRFNDLSRLVEGIAPNILTDRLRRLERVGVVASDRYSDRPVRLEYRLVGEGQELAGVLRLLAAWGGAEHGGEEGLHHAACGTTVEARWYCPTCARMIDDEEGSDLRYF